MIDNRAMVFFDRRLDAAEVEQAKRYIDQHATTLGTGGLMGPIIVDPYPAPFNRIIPWIHGMLRLETDPFIGANGVWLMPPVGKPISLKLLPGVDIRKHAHNDTPAIGLYYFSHGSRLNWQHRDMKVASYVDIEPGLLVLMDGSLEHWVEAQPEPDARYALAVVWRSVSE